MKVYGMANAGVLIEIDEENCIGVDLLCEDTEDLYPSTTTEQMEEVSALVGCEKLKLLFFTHEHSDHFSARKVKNVMDMAGKENECHIVATPGVVNALLREGVSKEQLIEIKTKDAKAAYLLSKTFPTGIEDVSVTFLQSRHDGAQYADVRNTAFLFNICGKKVVCAGDAAPVGEFYEAIKEWSEKIDLLIAPFPNLGLPRAAKALVQTLNVKKAACIHLPVPEKDSMGWIVSAKKTISGYPDKFEKDRLPEIIFQCENGRKCVLTEML